MLKLYLTITFVLIMTGQAAAFKLQFTQSDKLIRWDQENIIIRLDSSLELLGPLDQVEEEIKDAFLTWVEDSNILITFTFESKDCTNAHKAKSSNDQNCIFAKKQSPSKGDDIGGTTFITYADDSGKILSTDIVFFADAGEWSLNAEDEKLDLYSVALHEVGHFLGLSHSAINEASMYAMINVSEPSTQSLHSDDIFGVKALYDDGKVTEVSCTLAPSANAPSPGLLSLLF